MKVLMMPICAECGHIFDELRVSLNENPNPNIKNCIPGVDFDFEPAVCPNCGAHIEGVIYQRPIGDRFDFDASRYKEEISFKLGKVRLTLS